MTNVHAITIVIPVFCDGRRALDAISAILPQSLPPDVSLDVVVVDDGSTDDTPQLLARVQDPRVRILRLPENAGRSAARNAGSHAALGHIITFIDCDCRPVGDDFLLAHIAALADGAVASTGMVTGQGAGFWDRYQREASQRRRQQHAAGLTSAGSSQNLAVRRDVFERIGGFDAAYRRYGFEDRDLLQRLQQVGRIAWAEGACVAHLDALDMPMVSRKMLEGAADSAERFAALHPALYEALGYARLDARQHRILRGPARVARVVRAPVARMTDLLVRSPLPYGAKALCVRACTALSFLAGTAR